MKFKNEKPIAVDVLFKAIQWYHSHVDPIWPDSTFKTTIKIIYAAVRTYRILYVVSTKLQTTLQIICLENLREKINSTIFMY